MGIISWIVVGLIAGALAKLVLPGDDPGGIIVTAVIGMVGAVVGGFVFGIFGGTGATGFNVWSIVVATVGALVLLLIYRVIAETLSLRTHICPRKAAEATHIRISSAQLRITFTCGLRRIHLPRGWVNKACP